MTTVSAVLRARMNPTEENLGAAITALKRSGSALQPNEVDEALSAADMLLEFEDALGVLLKESSNDE
jgi:hypothetical protein